jgi:hypothetical protein
LMMDHALVLVSTCEGRRLIAGRASETPTYSPGSRFAVSPCSPFRKCR